MSKDTETIKRDAEAAQFRFALIAPVIQGLFPDTSATAYYKRVTAPPLTLPPPPARALPLPHLLRQPPLRKASAARTARPTSS